MSAQSAFFCPTSQTRFLMRSGMVDKSGRRRSLASHGGSAGLGPSDRGASGRVSSDNAAAAAAALTAAGGSEAVTEACVLSNDWMLLLQALSQVSADWQSSQRTSGPVQDSCWVIPQIITVTDASLDADCHDACLESSLPPMRPWKMG